MEQPGREDRLNAWIATERAARARLGASGTLELAQVAALSRRSSSTASAAASCPARPTANWSTSFPSSGPKGASCSGHPGPPPLQSAG